VKVGGTIDSIDVQVALGQTAPRQVPYAAAIMLTRLAGDVRERFGKRLPEVFDRPTPFTLRGPRSTTARASALEAEASIPDTAAAGGRQAREYMRPGVLGAFNRSQKKTEFLLTRLGVLPVGWITTPGKGAKLDGYGNLSGRIYAQIINVLQLKARVVGGRSVAERSQKRARKLGVEAEFFAVSPGANALAKGGGWLPPGVWRHLPGHRITQVLKFVHKGSYKSRLKMKDEAIDVVRKNAPARWREASATIFERFKRAR
jgi:hypothetical protein